MTSICIYKWIDYNIVCAQDYLIQIIIDFLSISDKPPEYPFKSKASKTSSLNNLIEKKETPFFS